MSWRTGLARLGAFMRSKEALERELEEEMQEHIRLETQDNIDRGIDPIEARRLAILKLGNPALAKEESRKSWTLPRMEAFGLDLRLSFRTLLKSRGFTVVALLTIALSVGASTAIFSVLDGVLLRPMDYSEPERIVLVWGEDFHNQNFRSQVSSTDIDDLRKQNNVFEAITNFADWTPTLSGTGEAERIYGTQVGDGFFQILRAQPLKGRFFSPEEQVEGKDNVVILSYGLWQRKFAGDPDIVGKTITLSTIPHVIVGVLPQDFPALPSTLVQGGHLYRPVAEAPSDTERASRHLRAIARLKPGVALNQAQTQLDLISHSLSAAYPREDTDFGFRAVSIKEDTVADLRPLTLIIFAAVCLLQLIACVNVANLMLTRTTAKQKEFSIRAALGASRSRIYAQILTESLVLACAGGLLGLLAAFWTMIALKPWVGKLHPGLRSISVNWKVVGFSIALSLLTAVLFGIAPAIQAARPAIQKFLQQSGRGVFSGQTRIRNFFIASQVAMAMVLLVAAGLLVKSFVRLTDVDPGFEAHQRIALNVWIPFQRYKEPTKTEAFYQQLLSRVRALPGVKSAALVQNPPLTNFDGRVIEVEGQTFAPGHLPAVEAYFTTPEYLATMGIPLREGCSIEEKDNRESIPVALVNETLAKKLWPAENPIGKRIRFPGTKQQPENWRTVVGIASDVKHFGLDRQAPPEIYIPFKQSPVTWMTLIVHASSDPFALVAPIRHEIRAIDPDVAAFQVTALDDVITQSVAVRKASVWLVTGFGIASFLLGMVGIFGVLSYNVSRRTQEFGVRLALGAQRGNIIHNVLQQGLQVTLIGIVTGAAIGIGLTPFMSRLLFQVAPLDIRVFSGAIVMMMVSALCALYIPAHRASRVEPITALRNE
jgi:putative ABC transport system permease protein